MFRATILTLYPEMFPGALGLSLAGRALEAGTWSLETVQIRDFATDRHRTVDDTPAGGGAGMVMRADVLAKAIDHASPDGRSAPAPLDEPARQAADAGARARTRGRSGRGHPLRPLRRRRPARHRRARPGRGLRSAISSCRAASRRRLSCSTQWCGCCPVSWATRRLATRKASRTGCWSIRTTRGRRPSRAVQSLTC